jgi:site-specific recombinase XerD
MSFHVVARNSVPASASPYRLLDDRGREVAWVNEFLDAQRLRQLSLRSVRAYAFDLLHTTRWFQAQRLSLAQLNQSRLLDYVRDQLKSLPQPTPQTVNHRLDVLRCLYRFHYGKEIPGKMSFPRTYTTRSPLGFGRPQQKIATTLRLRQPRRVIVPLSAEQVAHFWKGFRTFRDLAIVALMLLDGLRSCEVLALQLEDLSFSDARLRVRGKGCKERFVPLSADVLQVLQNYLHLERPLTNSSLLFVSLKGRRRGQRMTAAGLRSLFRHHRLTSRVPQANPHRFRHSFGANMVRAGMSLPALMHLMGHAHIHTTMLYVQLAPEDVWREYARAAQQRFATLSLPEKMP